MKKLHWVMSIVLLFTIILNVDAQTGFVNNQSPRVVAYGEASRDIEADAIVAYLNVWDATYSETDPQKMLSMQRLKIDQLGLRNYMTNPTYDGLKASPAGTPIELRFPSKSTYEDALYRASGSSDENVAVSIDFSYADVSAQKRQQAMDGLIEEAVGHAKRQADKIASASGVKLGSIVYVEELPNYNVYGYNDEGYGAYPGQYNVRISCKIQLHVEIVK